VAFVNTLEEQITEGKVQKIRDVKVNFNEITIIFENVNTRIIKELRFNRVINFTMTADCGNDYIDDMDIMEYRTLIGIEHEMSGGMNFYELIIDDYRVTIKCLSPAILTSATTPIAN